MVAIRQGHKGDTGKHWVKIDACSCFGPLNGRRSAFERLLHFERPVSPHPGPLPRGEGAPSSAGRRIQRSRNAREPALAAPSPSGRGLGWGGNWLTHGAASTGPGPAGHRLGRDSRAALWPTGCDWRKSEPAARVCSGALRKRNRTPCRWQTKRLAGSRSSAAGKP